MNDINGYYSCSINPNYISTWYTPFVRKARADFGSVLNFLDSPEQSTETIEYEHSDFWEDRSYPEPSKAIPVNFADNSHHGRISLTALKKIKKAIDYTVYLATPKSLPHTLKGKDFKFRLNFITLTLSSPQIHPDIEIKEKIFQPMLNSFRQKFKVINYVWRAEKQSNDNIHFHIVTDKFIPWNELRNEWNRHQQNLGYVTRYRERLIEFHKDGFHYRPELESHWNRIAQYKAYQLGKRNNWDNPNSSDVHSLQNVSNVKSYFVKYLTKDNQSDYNRKYPIKPDAEPLIDQPVQYSNLEGRLWGCSERLSKIQGARADLDNELTEELTRIKQNNSVHHFDGDFFSVSFVNIEYLIKEGFTVIPKLFEDFIRSTFPEYRPKDLFSVD